MGKKGSGNYSWLTVVKRAFRSPTKKSSRRKHEEFEVPEEEEEEKKREKKRWLFRKPSSSSSSTNNYSSPVHHPHQTQTQTQTQIEPKVIKSTRNPTSVNQLHNAAATIIQTAFRGYVARRAMVALKGIVKLQALIRGQNVRKQAKMTLKCMQALLRVQARLRDQHSIFPNDADAGTGGRKSMFAHCNNLWESRYLGEIRGRKSTSSTAAAAKRERCLSSVFSHQRTWEEEEEEDDEKQQENTNWLDKWMSTKQWDTYNYYTNTSRGTATAAGSIDNFIKTVEIDDFSTPNYSGKYQRPSTPGNYCYSAPSPVRRRQTSLNYKSSVPPAPAVILTPSRSPSTTTKNKVRSCSPRRPTKEEKSYSYSYSTANTPSSALRSLQRRLNSVNGSNNFFCRYSTSTAVVSGNANCVGSAMVLPSYMAATESAKARARSQSAPRQRPSTPERDQRGGLTSVRKRLLFPVPPVDQQAGGYYYTNAPYGGGGLGGYGTNTTYTAAPVGIINNQNLRSPSFKSLQAGYVGMEQQSNQSCYTDSIGGEISPCSTTDLRRWLR